MEDWRTNFCQNLHHLRQVHGMTQKEMAAVLGISVGTYGRLERGDPTVRILGEQVYRVCNRFEVSAQELLHQNWPEMLGYRQTAKPSYLPRDASQGLK